MPGRNVRLDVAVRQPVTEEGVERLLERVFLTSQDDVGALVPEHWRRFLREYRNPGWPEAFGLQRNDALSSRQLTPPQLVRHVRPRFPRVAESFTQSGVVVLEGKVTAEGTVAIVEVIQPRGFGFEEASIEAVRQWRYTPLLVDGVPQEVSVTVTIRFTMGDSD